MRKRKRPTGNLMTLRSLIICTTVLFLVGTTTVRADLKIVSHVKIAGVASATEESSVAGTTVRKNLDLGFRIVH